MFESSMIVQSAVSAFNNAALLAPGFLWWAILAMPLFAIVYFCSNAITTRIGWNKENITGRASLVAVVLTAAWIVLFGGNYAVLRDNATVLPFLIAAVVFISSVFIASYRNVLKFPRFRDAGRGQKWGIVAGWLVVLMAIGLSDVHTWWGPLLQIGAFLLGVLVGRVARAEMRPIPGCILIIALVTVAMLMQPEFFRFGQLGALTPIHLMFLILMAAAISGTVALRNVRPRGAIRHSAYVKIKWLLRFICVLCMALFVMTESVLVFLAMMAVFFVMFALSVWHADKLAGHSDERMFAIALGIFGIITVMPAVTGIGILYWANLPANGDVWRGIRTLL